MAGQGISLLLWLLERQGAKRGQAEQRRQMGFMGDVLGIPERGRPQPPPTMGPTPQGRPQGVPELRPGGGARPGLSKEALLAKHAPDVFQQGLKALTAKRAQKASILAHDLAERRHGLDIRREERLERGEKIEPTYLINAIDPEGNPHPFRVKESEYNNKVTELRKKKYHIGEKARLYPIWKEDEETGGILENSVLKNELPGWIKEGWQQSDYQVSTKPGQQLIYYKDQRTGLPIQVIRGGQEEMTMLNTNRARREAGEQPRYLRGKPWAPERISRPTVPNLNTLLKTGEGLIAKGMGLNVAFMEKWDVDQQKNFFDAVKVYHTILENKKDWQNTIGIRKAADWATDITKIRRNKKTGEIVGWSKRLQKWVNLR